MRRVAHQRLQDGILQRRGAVAFEQPHQARGDRAEIGASLRGAHQQGLAGWRGLRKAIGGTMLARGMLVVGEGLDVSGNLDLCAAVVAATR